MEPTAVALIAAVGGLGGIAAIIKVLLDYRRGKVTDERELERAETAKHEAEKDKLRADRDRWRCRYDAEREHNTDLRILLITNQIPLPPRPSKEGL